MGSLAHTTTLYISLSLSLIKQAECFLFSLLFVMVVMHGFHYYIALVRGLV
jgi:hypothetical protein